MYPCITRQQGAINFSVYSANATGINLCLFYEEDLQKGQVSYEIPLDPMFNKSGDNWHIMLPQLDETLLYGALLLDSLPPPITL